jgi:hypothetical protein
MRARFLLALAALLLSGMVACAETNVGAGAAYEAGSSISPLIPQFFVQNVYRTGAWQTFGIDFDLAVSPFENSSFANGMPAGPEVILGIDASYLFPRLGPAEFALSVGASGFQDYHRRANGVAAQTGLDATVHLGSFFIMGRGLYRFFSSTGASGIPVPLGTYAFAILGGYTLP